jgi:hypothetical protein
MSQDDAKTLPVREQFRRAALGACRPARAYEELKTPSSLSDNSAVKRLNQKAKSSAQVESYVKRSAVLHNSSGLKPEKARSVHLGIRLDFQERERLAEQAERNNLSTSQYVRLMLLKSPLLDPERNSLLHKVHFELTKQGTNLNQIAKQLNAGAVTNGQGASMVAMISRSLMTAHQAILQALSEGRTAE